LIVMGTHGRRGMRRLALGSDAEEVLRSTTIPVLFVRSAAAPANKVQNQSAA
jgi:nucleotide-binding universal stress UspA family protein